MSAPETTRRDVVAAILAELPMLKSLPEDARTLVIESFEPESFGFGTSIVEEGEAGDALYVILAGNARVLKRTEDGGEVSVEMLGPGDAFGEMALLDGIPRTATVRAHSPVDALRLDGTVFRALVRLKPEIKDHFEREECRRGDRLDVRCCRTAEQRVLPEEVSAPFVGDVAPSATVFGFPDDP